MMGRERIFQFSFGLGQMASWSLDFGPLNGKGLFDPKFSNIISTWQGTFPDHGLDPDKGPDLIYGEFLTPEIAARLRNPLPAFNLEKRNAGKLPADLDKQGDGMFTQRPIVSVRLRHAIEALEPGKHQFFPVSFVNRDLDPPAPVWTGSEWYYFNLLNWVAPDRFLNMRAMSDVIKRRTTDYGGLTVGFGIYQQKFVVERSYLDREMPERHLFVTSSYIDPADKTYFSLPFTFFCTETARKAFKAAGLKGYFVELTIA